MTATPADTIRRAATLMRQRATAAHVGTWTCTELPPNEHNLHTRWWVNTEIKSDEGTDYLTVADVTWCRADAEHIAGMHPAVALTVAAAFEATATAMDAAAHVREAELQSDSGDWIPIVVSGRGDRHHDWTAVLAAARAFLGEA